MIQNAIRAARLDLDFYNTIENDESFTGQAGLIVVITSLITGLGTAFAVKGFIWPLIVATIGGIVAWFVWSFLTAWIGTTLFDGQTDVGEMLRVLGFAQAPLVLAIIPWFGLAVGSIWALIASVVAVREGQDFTTGKAIGTVGIGWIAYLVIRGIWNFVF